MENRGLIGCSARSWPFPHAPTISSRIRQGILFLPTLRRFRRGCGSGVPNPKLKNLNCSFPHRNYSPVAVHILAVVLIVAGFVGMTLHYLHFQLRKGVKLYAQPGTIASAASITSDSGLSALVKPGFNEEQLRDALRGRKFTVDHTGRVILQDDGFGPERPLEKRRSVYGQLMRAAR